jgi:hypothetical protein
METRVLKICFALAPGHNALINELLTSEIISTEVRKFEGLTPLIQRQAIIHDPEPLTSTSDP